MGTWCSGKILVKSGKYKVYVKKGDVPSWGDRVHALYIVHEDFSLEKLSFKKTDIDVGVDSGQAGFFNEDLYQKDLPEEVPLIGDEQYNRRCHSHPYDAETLEKFKEFIKDKISKEEFERITENLKNKHNPVINPEDCEKSKEFYKVCCSMTLGDLSAGVEIFGAVSSSGFGDGGYSCYVSEGDEIVASYIEFITEEDIKENMED